jgi:hypothetical protein
MSLEENANSDLDDLGIGQLSPPKDIKIGAKTPAVLSGVPALKTEVTYVQKGVTESEETIYAIHRGAVYRFQLKCPIAERHHYEAISGSIVSSFHWSCSQ